MRIDGSQAVGRGYRYMIKTHANDLAVFLVSCVHCRNVRRQLFTHPFPTCSSSIRSASSDPKGSPQGEEGKKMGS